MIDRVNGPSQPPAITDDDEGVFDTIDALRGAVLRRAGVRGARENADAVVDLGMIDDMCFMDGKVLSECPSCGKTAALSPCHMCGEPLSPEGVERVLDELIKFCRSCPEYEDA